MARAHLKLVVGLCMPVGAAAQVDLPPTLVSQISGTSVLLQAVSAVDERVVWISGHGGTFVRTEDGGESWVAGVVPEADSMQFRDVHAVDASTAYLLAAGSGDRSRIYKTLDAGKSWTLQWTNDDPDGFFDCFDFWDADHGLVFGDAVDGRVQILRTDDGGEHWVLLPAEARPLAKGSEGGFAASGTCLVTVGQTEAWIGTGAGEEARVLHTTDRGDSWSTVAAPVTSGTGTTGLTSLTFADRQNGIAVGGDVGESTRRTDGVAVTRDGGQTWQRGGRFSMLGAAYAVATASGGDASLFVVAGPGGLNYSADGGATWQPLSPDTHWAVAFSGTTGWAAGPDGRITRIEVAASSDDSPVGEIRRRLEQYYADLSARDWEALRLNFWAGAAVTSTWQPPGEDAVRVVPGTIESFVEQAPLGPGSREVFEEWMNSVEIKVEGAIAQAWVRYGARFGDHRNMMEWEGIDVFSLLWLKGEWRIAALVYAPD